MVQTPYTGHCCSAFMPAAEVTAELENRTSPEGRDGTTQMSLQTFPQLFLPGPPSKVYGECQWAHVKVKNQANLRSIQNERVDVLVTVNKHFVMSCPMLLHPDATECSTDFPDSLLLPRCNFTDLFLNSCLNTAYVKGTVMFNRSPLTPEHRNQMFTDPNNKPSFLGQ